MAMSKKLQLMLGSALIAFSAVSGAANAQTRAEKQAEANTLSDRIVERALEKCQTLDVPTAARLKERLQFQDLYALRNFDKSETTICPDTRLQQTEKNLPKLDSIFYPEENTLTLRDGGTFMNSYGFNYISMLTVGDTATERLADADLVYVDYGGIGKVKNTVILDHADIPSRTITETPALKVAPIKR